MYRLLNLLKILCDVNSYSLHDILTLITLELSERK